MFQTSSGYLMEQADPKPAECYAFYITTETLFLLQNPTEVILIPPLCCATFFNLV